jgi:hypothetical protein
MTILDMQMLLCNGKLIDYLNRTPRCKSHGFTCSRSTIIILIPLSFQLPSHSVHTDVGRYNCMMLFINKKSTLYWFRYCSYLKFKMGMFS